MKKYEKISLMLILVICSLVFLQAAERQVPKFDVTKFTSLMLDPDKKVRDEKIQNKFAEIEAAFNFAKNYNLTQQNAEILLQQIKAETVRFIKAMDELASRQFTKKQLKTSSPLITFPRKSIDPSGIDLSSSIPIWDKTGQFVLMVSYVPQKYVNLYEPGKTFKTDKSRILTWVSPVPELLNFIRNYTRQAYKISMELRTSVERKGGMTDFLLNKRIQQYLGLQPSLQKYYCIEMWIKPEDLFRVCLNPDVEQRICEIPLNWNIENYYIEIQKKLLPRHDSSFRTFMIDKFKDTYRIDPWPYTALGFTFDWGSDPAKWDKEGYKGADEFGVLPESTLIIRLVMLPEEYATMPIPRQGKEDVNVAPRAPAIEQAPMPLMQEPIAAF